MPTTVCVNPRLTSEGRHPYDPMLTPPPIARCKITFVHFQGLENIGVALAIGEALRCIFGRALGRAGYVDMTEDSRTAWDEVLADAIQQRCHVLVVVSRHPAPIPVDHIVTVARGQR